MNRHESSAPGMTLPFRSAFALVIGVIALISGCVPTEGDIVSNATGTAIAQLVGFIADFARQMLAAYLF